MLNNILVTGGAGFIGSNLVLHLQELYPNAFITVIDDFRSGDFKNLRGFKGDVIADDLSTIQLNKLLSHKTIDVVFHQASITDTTIHDQRLQVNKNVEGWRTLLNYFAGSSTQLIFASSAAIYGISSGINSLNDDAKPANVYAFSKVLLENLAHAFKRENKDQKVVGLRYFNVYGPREEHKQKTSSMIMQLARQIASGNAPQIFHDGNQKRDFVYVKDIVSYNIAALNSKVNEKTPHATILNAGSGSPRSFNDVIFILNDILGSKLETKYIPLPYSFYQPHTEADLTETINILQVKPQFNLESGIRDYFNSGFLLNNP